jgi:hypothetical protein
MDRQAFVDGVAALATPTGKIGKLVTLVMAGSFLAGCGGVSTSSAWQAQCPQGPYAPQSLNEWFRSSWDVTQGRRGPQVEGYIYNNFSNGAEQMLLAVERVDASGQAVGCSMVWVAGPVPPRDRGYFVAPVPDASAQYRVRVLSFNWEKRRGG